MASGSINEQPSEKASDNSSSAAISEALGALWHKRRAEVVADLQSLLAHLADLEHRADRSDGIATAQAMAHRLHGTFGVFGLSALKDDFGSLEQSLIAGDTSWGHHIDIVRRVLADLP